VKWTQATRQLEAFVVNCAFCVHSNAIA